MLIYDLSFPLIRRSYFPLICCSARRLRPVDLFFTTSTSFALSTAESSARLLIARTDRSWLQKRVKISCSPDQQKSSRSTIETAIRAGAPLLIQKEERPGRASPRPAFFFISDQASSTDGRGKPGSPPREKIRIYLALYLSRS